VEDYFKVSAFAPVVSRADWDGFERRVTQNTDRLLKIFAEHNVHATFFVLGWVAEREPLLVRRIAAAGHEIASHGYSHSLVYDQAPAEFRDDVRRSKAVLEAVIGQPVIGYRAPSFSITNRSLWALDVLIEEGFTYDASVFPIHHDRYGISSAPRHAFWIGHGTALEQGFPGLNGVEGSPARNERSVGQALLEIPASTLRFVRTNFPVGGGGYFRLLPYRSTRWAISLVNSVEGKPVVFYLHPWEIDPEQPRLEAGWLSRFRHYHNLDATEVRLRRLLAEFRFDSVSAVLLGENERREDTK
jgi:polysaccharide deacetylase family protein (PEP-CTERM system associated)